MNELLEWTRPLGLWALSLPLSLLLFALRRPAPRELATGSLALWSRVVARRTAGDARRRPRIPLCVWLAVASLTGGALALAGPRRVVEREPRTWEVVVDGRPSLSLPAPASGAESGEGSRLGAALAALTRWLRSQALPGDLVRWRVPGRELRVTPADEPPPLATLRAPAGSDAPVDWTLHDLPLTLWLTDLLPEPTPGAAGVFASGAEVAPGPVAVAAGRLEVFDGETVRPGEALPPRTWTWRGPAGEDVLSGFVEVWAADRGLERAEGPGRGGGPGRVTEGGADLVLVRATGPSLGPAVAAGPGFRLRGELARVEGEAALEGTPWLRAVLPSGEERVALSGRPGRALVALRDVQQPGGDPAAFALALGRWLDGLLPLPADVVPLAERLRTGPPAARPPAVARGPEGASRERGGDDPLAAFLGFAALGLAAAALSTGLLRG